MIIHHVWCDVLLPSIRVYRHHFCFWSLVYPSMRLHTCTLTPHMAKEKAQPTSYVLNVCIGWPCLPARSLERGKTDLAGNYLDVSGREKKGNKFELFHVTSIYMINWVSIQTQVFSFLAELKFSLGGLGNIFCWAQRIKLTSWEELRLCLCHLHYDSGLPLTLFFCCRLLSRCSLMRSSPSSKAMRPGSTPSCTCLGSATPVSTPSSTDT